MGPTAAISQKIGLTKSPAGQIEKSTPKQVQSHVEQVRPN